LSTPCPAFIVFIIKMYFIFIAPLISLGATIGAFEG